MESFGLFHLLQSLLPKAEEERKNKGNDEYSSAAPADVLPASEKAGNGAESTTQNACLDFLARHDERMKGVRKK